MKTHDPETFEKIANPAGEEAQKLGRDKLEKIGKPSISDDSLMEMVVRQLARKFRSQESPREPQKTYVKPPEFKDIVGESDCLLEAIRRADSISTLDVLDIFLVGETGTGKELFAKAIHRKSERKDGPFKSINCAALSPTLLGSELFGHVKGAYTDAKSDRKGVFELANGGTIFLDEITECDPENLAKLLRVLEPDDHAAPTKRKFFKTGDFDNQVTVDVKVIMATNREPTEAVKEGRLRRDLWERAGFKIWIPPLRERGKADILAVANHLLRNATEVMKESSTNKFPEKKSFAIPKSVKNKLTKYHWPGNVRELRNVLIDALIMSISSPELLNLESIEAAMDAVCLSGMEENTDCLCKRSPGETIVLEDRMKDIEERFHLEAYHEAGRNGKGGALLLGKEPSAFNKYMRIHKLKK